MFSFYKNKEEKMKEKIIKDDPIKLGLLEEIWYYAEGHQKVKINNVVYVTWIEWNDLPTLKVGSTVKYSITNNGPTIVQHSINKQVEEDCIKIISVV
jgi:hypothetical protein